MRGVRTPRLVIDEATLDRNIRKMAERAAFLGLALRPHAKTHKCPEVMQRQLDAGAAGIAVATLHEAEVFVAAGAEDVLVAYPPVGPWRLEALASLAGRARLIVACNAPEQVHALAALGLDWEYYWEVDCGAGRLGTQPGEETARVLEQLADVSGARLAGLMAFPGHAYGVPDPAARADVARAEGEALESTKQALAARGLDAGVLSGGSTPTAGLDEGKAALDEYRCGNYVFCDATQVALGSASLEDCALTVEATVVGRPAPDRVILDSGSKALAAERMSGATTDFGIVLGHPSLQVAALYEEHAICRTTDGAESALDVGELVHVVPNHACTCANLHDRYVVRANGEEPRSWTIAARGW